MANIGLYIDKRRKKDDGSFPIKIYVNHISRFYVSTKMSAVPENWEEQVGYNKREPNWKAKNIVLRRIINVAEEYILSLENEGKLRSMSDKKLKADIEDIISGNSKHDKNSTFVEYLDEFLETKKNKNTREIYELTRSKVTSFDGNCTFATMDNKWLLGFENYLIDKEGMKINACAIHMRNIRSVFNWAIDEEYTSLYPFRKFKIKKEETRKRSLTVEQLRLLRDYPCEEYQKKYRDMFMLMFYLIGVNAIDLFLATPDQVHNGRLEYKRSKTGRLYSVFIPPEAWEIIERYKGKKYLLNVMDEYSNYKDFLHRMGVSLKDIGEMKRVGLGGKKIRKPLFPDISSYWSRHTWATIAAGLDIPKEVIAHALGHAWASNTTTDIYIKFDEKKVDDANRRVIDYVNSEKCD